MKSTLFSPTGSRQSGRSTNSTKTAESSPPQSQSTELQTPSDTAKGKLRSSVNSDFPWIAEEFEPIRTTATSSSPQWFRDAQNAFRSASTRSQPSGRSSRATQRESVEDLGLIASDMDYYAGAVSDLVYTTDSEVWDEEKGFPADDSEYANFGQIEIVRAGAVKRSASRQSHLSEKDVNLVTWDGPDDPDNPKNWTKPRKWLATMTVSMLTFISPVSSSMIAPALAQIQIDLNISSDLVVELALSAFILGFALGPLVLGPLSELFGRRWVLLCSASFYFIFNLAAGFSHSAGEVIAFRFLSGLGGSAPLGIGGGVLADIWMPQERGKAMALYSLMPLLGPALGPVAGGFIAEYSTWRWVFWSTSIVAAVIIALSMALLKETYAATILAQRKKHLIRLTGNANLRTEFDNPSRSFGSHLATALKRPFVMLFTQPIVQVLALYIGYLFGVLYLVLASFPQVWASHYNEGPAIGGLNYISLGVGFFLGTQIAARFADKIYKHLKARQAAAAAATAIAAVDNASKPSIQQSSGLSSSASPPSSQPAVSSAAPPATPAAPAPAGPPTASSTAAGPPAAGPGAGRPEFRVPLMFPGAVIVPIGLLMYGWAAQQQAPWIVPNLGAAMFAAGNQLVFQNCQTYLVDAYTRYAASAIAATAVLRSLAGFAFPLFAPAMYAALGDGWGNSALALLGLVVGLPVPCVLWWYGEGLRKKSAFAAG